MFSHLPSLKALHAFESAARLLSFAKAADELSVSPGAISYQIKMLEDALSTPLFKRKTRKVELTSAGQTLFQTMHRQFQELDSALSSIVPTVRNTALTVSVSTYFVTRWLSPRLGRFLNSHPDITIRLQHSVNDPDFNVDDTDVAIRWGDGSWTGSKAHLLFSMPMIAVCSPELLNDKYSLRSLKNLKHHTLLRDQASTDYWSEWLKKAKLEQPLVTGPVIVDPNVRVQSAIDGLGITLANPLLDSTISEGALCEPFNIRLEGYGYYLVYSKQAEGIHQFQVFRDWLLSEADLMAT